MFYKTTLGIINNLNFVGWQFNSTSSCLLFLFRYKILDRLDQDRKLMLFQHLGFVHCPIREHCPAFPNCMDALIVRILATKAHR